ncbi:MAG: hypothetical protein EAY72_13695 [Bacteroidetes bacterium]|nr:MAG: hypothetical protein EAY72_13695 [Bacteroidota bacterium]
MTQNGEAIKKAMKVLQNKFLSFTVLFCLLVGGLQAQDLLKRGNLATVRVDQLTDAEIIKYQQQLKSSGLTEAQAEQIALSRGMSPGEIAKLRQRANALNAGGTNTPVRKPPVVGAASGEKKQIITNNPDEGTQATAPPSTIDPKIFGSELFSTPSLSFEPNLKIATPLNYELGPDDQIQITVFGVQEVAHDLAVSTEGSVYVPNVGQIKVAGLTFEAATNKIKTQMANSAYPTIKSGMSKFAMNLSKIRSIKVTVVGSNRPGSLTLSSLSTLFNALYSCGGPSANGSFREIELIRNNKIERKVDLYKFLLYADQSDNVRLRDNDVIRIPVYKNRVELAGEVKRPGIFEMLPGESFASAVQFAGGFTENAYRANVKVIQLTNKERRLRDIDNEDFGKYFPLSGDNFEVGKILNKFENRVLVQGALMRPSSFALNNGMRVADLIRKADGLREDAYTQRAILLRIREDLTKEVVAVDIAKALAGDVSQNILLQKDDQLTVNSIFELRDQFTVSIQGEVRKGGSFPLVDSLNLKDLVFLAGGLTDAAYLQRVEVARFIRRDTLTADDTRLTEVFTVDNADDLSVNGKGLMLKPFDVVTIRRKPGYKQLQSVAITGEVQFPGPYVLIDRNEKLTDLIKRSGGFTPEAFVEGAFLKRQNKSDLTDQVKSDKVAKIQEQLKDTTGRIVGEVERTVDRIPVDLAKVLANPAIPDNLLLEAGDELFIPKFDAQVRVNGEVIFPTQLPFSGTNSFKDYVNAAGGFSANALKRKSYVIYANGRADVAKKFLFFRTYPKVKPGAEIVVPKYIAKEQKKLSTAEIIGLSSAVASMAGVVIAILNFTR